MQVVTNKCSWVKDSSSVALHPITPHLGKIFESGGHEAMLEWLLTLVMVDKEQDARLKPILQSAVHGQLLWDIITLLDVDKYRVPIHTVLADFVGLGP